MSAEEAEKYRDLAALCRRLAGEALDADAARSLRESADGFDRQAEGLATQPGKSEQRRQT